MGLSWGVPNCPEDTESGISGIILGCPNCPNWDTGWEGQWDLGHPVGQVGLSRDVPIVLGTQDEKDNGIWATQWDKWDCLEMSQLSLGHRMGRTVGFRLPSGMNGIILGCTNCPNCANWDTGWEGQWDLDDPVGQMGLSWDVPIVLGTQDGKDSGI